MAKATGTDNCISYQVYDDAAAGDHQAIVLASPSLSGSCFYGLMNNKPPVAGVARFTAQSASSAGVVYDRTGRAASCTASDAEPGWTWRTSVSELRAEP